VTSCENGFLPMTTFPMLVSRICLGFFPRLLLAFDLLPVLLKYFSFFVVVFPLSTECFLFFLLCTSLLFLSSMSIRFGVSALSLLSLLILSPISLETLLFFWDDFDLRGRSRADFGPMGSLSLFYSECAELERLMVLTWVSSVPRR